MKETEDRMKICTIEMAKLDVEKSLEEMNEQEKMIYYFLNCHKGVMIESDGMIQMLEKRVETISDDGWKKIIEDFRKLHENEERMERQLELEELQKVKEEVRKEKEELQKAQEEACKEKEEARKVQQETARILDESDKKVNQMNQEIKKMIQIMLSNGMSLEFVSKSLSKSEDEILDLLK